jgi:hypothetical protein
MSAWSKWLPSWPTSSYWYTTEGLCALIAAYIGKEGKGAKARTIRDFLAEFDGLTGTVTRKTVLANAGLMGTYLHDLVHDDEVDMEAVERLLDAMKAASRSVKPKALGIIGESHLAASLVSCWEIDRDSIRYRRVAESANDMPFVLEVAFGVQSERHERRREIIAGVNWSPILGSPFPCLPSLLGEARVDEFDPVTVIVHLACPRPEFTDRGKGRLALPAAIEEALQKCVRLVTKTWREAKRHADREGRLLEQQMERLRKARQAKKLSIKQAAYRVMEEAYMHASGNKSDPANARQVMYTARPRVLELTGGKCWSHSSYFTQVLLPGFIEANPELTKEWNVVFDARGRLIEPHTGRRIDLGTLEVRHYIRGWTSTCPDSRPRITIPTDCPTDGPTNRYRFALFIEKEGFYQLLERNRIADRYDVAIMSTKGMSVTAARELVDRLCEQGVTVLVLRDFDKSGFSIVHTLRTDSARYRFSSTPNVLDIGLRLEDVREWGLLPLAEPVVYRNANKDPRESIRAAGATEDEAQFLVAERTPGGGWSGRRVELNALTSPQFIRLIEHKFADVGVAKVVPTRESLERAFRHAWMTEHIQEAMDKAAAAAAEDELPTMPRALPGKIARGIKGTGKSWDEVLSEIVREIRAKRVSQD